MTNIEQNYSLLNELSLEEYKELNTQSKIHPDLIELNFFHLEGIPALDRLLISDRLKRLNTGIISSTILKRYRHIEAGGWWVSGVDVLNNFEDDLWGQFKPSQPRLTADKGKIIKYEAPPKYSTGIMALHISIRLWQAIANRYQIPLDISDLAFWQWVVNSPYIPLIITEGAKKAAALLSQGFVAIAIPGVFNGYRQPKDELGRCTGLARLIPQLEVFAKAGRTIYFAFDKDTKVSTIANVNKAIAKTGKLFAKAGVDVKVIDWQKPAKGVDDLIVNHGVEAFERAYNQARSLETWSLFSSVELTYKANVRVNRRYLGSLVSEEEGKTPKYQEWDSFAKESFAQNQQPTSDIVAIPSEAKLIGIKSPKGTGKTYLLEQIVERATYEGKWVLLLTHRIQLGEALCQRVGLPYLTEVRTTEYGSVLGYGLCIDSLHPNSGARFNADNWQDGVIIIDEVEQVIWHLLNSATCTRDRVEILTQFKTLIQNNLSGEGKVYLADADLSDLAIDYIRSLAGFYVSPFLIVNDWKPSLENRWTVYNYEDKNPARLVGDLVASIESGDRPLISCSAQKIKSKWGTQNLESYLQQRFPDKKILRIDSESVSDPHHPAYGCISHLNEVLPDYDIAIASPSIETGVSIECQRITKVYHSKIPLALLLLLRGIKTNMPLVEQKSHFDSVWTIAQGVQSADSIRQVLARVRANVPRYLWAAPRGFYKCMVGNGSTVKKALIASTKNKASRNIRFLQIADADLNDLDLDFQPESLNTWAKRGCYINMTMQNYRASIVEGLIEEGHDVVSAPSEHNSPESNPTGEVESQLKLLAQTRYKNLCTRVVDTPIPTDLEYQKLKDKRAKTREERWIERKGNLVRRYGRDIRITPELVAKDDEGWYGKILSHYYLTVGRQYLIKRDTKQLKAIAIKTKNRLWLPDFNRSLLSTSLRLLETLVVGLLEPGVHYRGSDPNLQLIAELAKTNKTELKTFLGITIVESDSPIAIAQKLLQLLGLKLTYLGRKGSRTRRERVYLFEPPYDERDEIFASWLERDTLAVNEESAIPHSSNNVVSTIGKENNLSLSLDETNNISSNGIEENELPKVNQTVRAQNRQKKCFCLGERVKLLKSIGTWIVKATTGAISKIENDRGRHMVVNNQDLILST